jgi:hypothetical protein
MARRLPSMFPRSTLLALACLAAAGAPAQEPCVVGFEDVDALSARGWSMKNNSDASDVSGWTQGDPHQFPAEAPPYGSYAMSGTASSVGRDAQASTWLITPEIEFGPNGFSARAFAFSTRSRVAAGDRLFVRLCMGFYSECRAPSQGSSDLGNFAGEPLIAVNRDGLYGTYPTEWTRYAAGAGFPVVGRGRIAFHYSVDDAESDASSIGIDSVEIVGTTFCPFSEPVFTSGFDGA